jgi:arginase
MDIALIKVPYHAGDEHHGAGAGPGRLEASAGDLLRAQGHRVSIAVAQRHGRFRDTASSSAAVNRSVASLTREALTAGAVPLVLAGSCVTCHGVLAGLNHRRCGAVWIDAHGDFNTPETSTSGFFPGMSLAVATGACYRNYWRQITDAPWLVEGDVVMFGVRDLSPDAERERLERSAITVVGWRDGEPGAEIEAALDGLAERVRDIYLHLDLDGFAPDIAPGVADEPVPGGLTLKQAQRIIFASASRFCIRAATLATFTPDGDEDEKTLRLGLRLIEMLAEATSSPLPPSHNSGGSA